MKIKRYIGNPILKPKPESEWECQLVFNAAAIYERGLFHLFYRAVGVDRISRIGYAVSEDGFNFLRLDKPIVKPRGRLETKGCEDPRVVKIEDTFYMTYSACSEEGVRVALACSKNLISWEKMGTVLFPTINNKDAVLFPEKIEGRYVMLHRPMHERPLSIWIAYSENLVEWSGYKKVMSPGVAEWDEVKIGASPPPIKTEKGWLLLYHGVDRYSTYRMGIALMDLKDPSRLLYRHPEPILEPEEDYELRGEVHQVVFSCGLCEVGDEYYIYYGGADRVVCVATMKKDQILSLLP